MQDTIRKAGRFASRLFLVSICTDGDRKIPLVLPRLDV